MRDGSVLVLVVGENLQRCVELHRWVGGRGLRHEYASCYRDACDRLSRRPFDLVLSEYQLPDRSAFPLLDMLVGSPATLFFSRVVEADSLWLMMLDRGRRCGGAPVVRSNELHGTLDNSLRAIEDARESERLADELCASPFEQVVSR